MLMEGRDVFTDEKRLIAVTSEGYIKVDSFTSLNISREIIPATVAAAATVKSSQWIKTSDLISMILHFSITGVNLTSGDIAALYSIDGVTEINSDVIKSLTGGASEIHSIDSNEFVINADAAGFVKKIQNYPYVSFGLINGVGTFVSTTIHAHASVVYRG